MAFPIETFTAFVAGAPLANTPGSSDMLALIQDGATKRLPANAIPQLVVRPTVEVTTAAYQILITDSVVNVNRGPVAATVLTLPDTPGAGRQITVKDIAGNLSGGNNISFAGGTIDGGALILTTPYASVTLISTGHGNNWSIVARV